MKFFAKEVLVLFFVFFASLCFFTCAKADELESALANSQRFQLKSEVAITDLDLEDELARDEVSDDLEAMMEAQDQEDLLQSLMGGEDHLNSGTMTSENYRIVNGHFGTFSPASR